MMNLIVFLAFFYKIIYTRKTHNALCVEEQHGSNNTDWKSNIIIKYTSYDNNDNTTNAVVKKKKVPTNVLGCDMRFTQKDSDAQIRKIQALYNKMEVLKTLQSSNIGTEDKLRIIENYSIITPPELYEETTDKNLLDTIRSRLNRSAEITEFWWFYDW